MPALNMILVRSKSSIRDRLLGLDGVRQVTEVIRDYAKIIDGFETILKVHRSLSPMYLNGDPRALSDGMPGDIPSYPLLRGTEIYFDNEARLMTARGYLAVVNLSLGANPYVSYDPGHPINAASKRLSALAPVTVATGNNGFRTGEITSSPWSRAPWVISVGATESPDGEAVAEYSSGGIPENPSTWPVVVAYGASSLDPRRTGTSYAAPNASRQIIFLTGFTLTLRAWIKNLKEGYQNGIPLIAFGNIDRNTSLKPRSLPIAALPFIDVDLDAIRRVLAVLRQHGVEAQFNPSPQLITSMLVHSARPVPGAPRHRAGGGFVGDATTELIPSWLRFAELQCVNGFREFPGAPGAAAELAEDFP